MSSRPQGSSQVGVMDGEEAPQTADPDQQEEQEQQVEQVEQSAEPAKPAETRSEWDTDLEPDSRSS